jgi:hypothetical protein
MRKIQRGIEKNYLEIIFEDESDSPEEQAIHDTQSLPDQSVRINKNRRTNAKSR